MKKKVLLSLVLILLGSLTMTLCKVQAAEPADLETLQKLEIVTPAGEYKTGDTISFKATFEKDIAGLTTTGSLKIGFSESKQEREIFSNTAVNNTVTYQYTIKEEDKGTLTFKMYSIKALTASNGSVKTDGFDNNVVIKANVAEVPSPTPTPTDGFTDFSKAQISLVKDGQANAKIQVKNVQLNENHTYYIKIGSSKEIEITQNNNDAVLSKSKEDGVYYSSSSINKYVELNQDIYMSILEYYYDNESKSKIVIEGKKLERFAQPKYADAFFATFMAKDGTQIVTNFTHDKENVRKMQIKVGKITDINILKKIKNKDSTGFAELLSYAKSNSGIYDKNMETDKTDSSLEYSYGQPAIDVPGLTDGEYYFLYVKPDTENGKYIETEAVTLARASVYPNQNNAWYLFFYGNDDFKWSEFAEGSGKDDTIVPDKIIPQTGVKSLVGATIILTICVGGVLTYAGYRKNNYK